MAMGENDFNLGDGMSGAEKTRWLSSNMAQLMVFLNGLILTATAFSVLNVFINQMVIEGLIRTSEETQMIVSERYSDLEHTIFSVSSIIEQSTNINEKQIQKTLEDGLFPQKAFDAIFWLHEDAGGQWSIRKILQDEGKGLFYDSLILQPGKPLIDSIVAELPPDTNIHFLPGPKGTKGAVLGSRIQAQEKPFAIQRTVHDANGRRNVLVGYARLSDAVTLSWLNKQEYIQEMTINDHGKMPLYVFKKQDVSIASGARKYDHVDSAMLRFSDRPLSIKIGLMPGQKESFLKKIPMLLLLFGTTLTLIGTLYVRNNQNQSLKLTMMNSELAQKNAKLNSENRERERLNQVIRKAERDNRAVIDSVSDIIFETSTAGEVLFLNETWRKVTGFDLEQSIGRKLFDMLHPQDQDEQRRAFELMVKGRRASYRAFTRLRTNDGTFRAVELAVSMIRQDEYKNMRVVGTITDVEERRRAERALAEAEKKYRTIVENAAGGIYQVTPEGQYLSANPSMARILGYDHPEQLLREIRNASTQVYVNERERREFLKAISESDLGGYAELQVRRKDGIQIWIGENARGVKDEEGNYLYYEGSIEDITERKEAESALREAKIQSDLASRAKSEFLANMSHELRTPLNAIIGFSEIIKNEVLGPIGQRAYWEYARDIHESGARLLKVINEILDVSRIDAGERQLNEGIVDLNKVVNACLALTSPKVTSKHLVVYNTIREDVPKIIGEELAVKQMVMNLISNAIKFTPDSGTITLKVDVDSGRELRLSVTDTGIGFDDKDIHKALSPFGQVNSEFSRDGSGTGLGLTLVNALIRLHGGRLEIMSQKGVGTSATLVFPPRRVSQQPSAKTPEKPKLDA